MGNLVKKNSNCPIVGHKEYGMLGLVVELGRRLFLCLPHVELKAMKEENCIYFCQQNDCLSPLEIFMILMWNLENAVIGGYVTNVEDSINFLMRNGITMSPGRIALSLNIEKDNNGQYSLYRSDDRDIRMTRFDSLEDMADALYNLLFTMNAKFGEEINVDINLEGEEAKYFALLLEGLHPEDKDFKMEVL